MSRTLASKSASVMSTRVRARTTGARFDLRARLRSSGWVASTSIAVYQSLGMPRLGLLLKS